MSGEERDRVRNMVSKHVEVPEEKVEDQYGDLIDAILDYGKNKQIDGRHLEAHYRGIG